MIRVYPKTGQKFAKTDIVQCSYIAKCNNKYSIGLVAILVAAPCGGGGGGRQNNNFWFV